MPRRLANRLRSLLPEDQRTLLEAALASLAPLLDISSPHPADLPAEGQGPELVPALAAGHAVVEELAQQGCQRAEALAQAAADSAAQLVAAPAAAAAGEAAAAGGQQEAGEGSSGEEQPAAASQPALVPSQQPAAPAALKALAGLHADAVKSVAELCSLCLERLLALGRSINYFYRSGRPANDGAPAVWREATVHHCGGRRLCVCCSAVGFQQPCIAVCASHSQAPTAPSLRMCRHHMASRPRGHRAAAAGPSAAHAGRAAGHGCRLWRRAGGGRWVLSLGGLSSASQLGSKGLTLQAGTSGTLCQHWRHNSLQPPSLL